MELERLIIDEEEEVMESRWMGMRGREGGGGGGGGGGGWGTGA